MADIFYDRVCETTTTTGTGDITLAGAVTGFQTFNNAGVGSSAYTSYLVEAVDTNGTPTGDWEAGFGLLSSSTNLQRIAVTGSSNSGSPVSFAAGTKRVHLAANASQLSAVGGVWDNTSNLTSQNFTTATAITWGHQQWSFDPTNTGFHSNVTNTSRVTIPTGYEPCIIRLSGQIALQNITVTDWVEIKIRANGAGTPVARATAYVATTTPVIQIQSKAFYSGETNYYELLVQVGADTSVDLVANESWFGLEVLQ